MKKLILFVILFLVFQNARAQAIQGTIRHGSHSKEVYLTIRNNSGAKISGNITRLDFTISMFIQSIRHQCLGVYGTVYVAEAWNGNF